MVVTKSNASTSVVFLAAVFCCNEVSDRGFLVLYIGVSAGVSRSKVSSSRSRSSNCALSALELLNWHP